MVAALPPGPGAPRVVQALRYSLGFPRFLAENRRRYGPTWTLRLPGAPPSVVTSDRDAIERAFTGDPLRRRHGNDVLRPFVGDRSLMVLDPAEHLARRKQVLPALHRDRMALYRRLVAEEAERALGGLSGEVRVRPAAQDMTLAVIARAVFGMDDPAGRARLREIFGAMDRPLFNFGVMAPALNGRRNPAAGPFYRRLDELHAILDAEIARARREAGERDDVLAMLVQTGLDDIELRDDLVTLVSAGHETTATAISWAADLLAHHPAVVSQLREGDREYLRATAQEVLRLRTVVPVSAGRFMSEPFDIGPWTVPVGVCLLVDAVSNHHDPGLHPDPRAFRPERFIDADLPPYSFLPFGGGAHRCAGAQLALLELETAIELLATTYDLTPTGPPDRAVRRGGVTMAPRREGRVVATPRRPRAPRGPEVPPPAPCPA